MLFSAFFFFFSGAFLEHLTDHKDLNLLVNFWINEQPFIILFKISIAFQVTEIFHVKAGAQNEQKMIIFSEQNLIIFIL